MQKNGRYYFKYSNGLFIYNRYRYYKVEEKSDLKNDDMLNYIRISLYV